MTVPNLMEVMRLIEEYEAKAAASGTAPEPTPAPPLSLEPTRGASITLSAENGLTFTLTGKVSVAIDKNGGVHITCGKVHIEAVDGATITGDTVLDGEPRPLSLNGKDA